MTESDTDKLVRIAAAAGASLDDSLGYYRFSEAALSAFASAHIASLCGDVEPVAHMWQHDETGRTGFVEHAPAEELEQWERINKPRRFVAKLYPATTVAALKAENEALRARVAELEDFIVGIGQDLHHERVADWYPEGANNAALAMSESMRLIGNRCVDFDAALKKGQP